MFLLAHPLHAHRPPRHRKGDQRRVRRRVIGAVVTIAAGTFQMDAAHLLGGKLHHLGDRLPQRIHPLSMAVHGERAVAELGDRTARTDRAMHLVVPPERRLDRPRLGHYRGRLVQDDVFLG